MLPVLLIIHCHLSIFICNNLMCSTDQWALNVRLDGSFMRKSGIFMSSQICVVISLMAECHIVLCSWEYNTEGNGNFTWIALIVKFMHTAALTHRDTNKLILVKMLEGTFPPCKNQELLKTLLTLHLILIHLSRVGPTQLPDDESRKKNKRPSFQ